MGKAPQVNSKAEECVRVVVRCRPMNAKEKEMNCSRTINVDVKRGVMEVHNPNAKDGDPPKAFTYDSVYDWNSKQLNIYEETARPIVDSVLQGFNGTIFAYGQTGTGKTFTMEGVRSDPELRGVIPNAFDHIFRSIGQGQGTEYLVHASYMEIYQEEIRDLLSKDIDKRLDLKEYPEKGFHVKDLSSFVVKSSKEIDHVMNVGSKHRKTGSTNMNERSSRSHSIFTISIESSSAGADGKPHIRAAKLNLVDLAGSERQGKTGAEGIRLKEATKINLSLSALGNVISALVDGRSSHVPYRDSKLTKLLMDSLGGNAKTVMVANVGPADYNYDETLSTLRYANRAKNIKNRPKVNEDPKDALLREYQDEIARLKEALESGGSLPGKKKKKKKRRKGEKRTKTKIVRNADGEEIEVTDSESEGENNIDETEILMQQERDKLEAEKAAILNNRDMLKEEKQRIAADIDARSRELQQEQQERSKLSAQLKALEGKLLAGGDDIFDRTARQQIELHKREQELLEREHKERELQQALITKEEMSLAVEETYTSLAQEVEIKTKKLKKLWNKLLGAKQEIADLQQEFCAEREELLEASRDLQRDILLKKVIVEQFIPPQEVQKIESRAQYNESRDDWILTTLTMEDDDGNVQKRAPRPMSVVGQPRPVSDFSHMQAALGDHSARFKANNIVTLELEMPNRTTMDYEGPAVSARVQAALDAALQDEDDMYLKARPDIYQLARQVEKGSKKKSKKKRPPIGGGGISTGPTMPSQQRDDPQYPTARGMVDSGAPSAMPIDKTQRYKV